MSFTALTIRASRAEWWAMSGARSVMGARALVLLPLFLLVIPAKAGIQGLCYPIRSNPKSLDDQLALLKNASRLRGNDGARQRPWVPAFAGTTTQDIRAFPVMTV
jgi:hypothetical protein